MLNKLKDLLAGELHLLWHVLPGKNIRGGHPIHHIQENRLLGAINGNSVGGMVNELKRATISEEGAKTIPDLILMQNKDLPVSFGKKDN